MIRQKFAGFFGALVFLSRLPCQKAGFTDFKTILPFFGIAGLLISLLALFPVPILFYLASFTANSLALSLLAAALWLLLEACLTGCMHWDGLADLADAWAAAPARFREVLADSRVGATGALAIGLFLLVEASAAASHFMPFFKEGACFSSHALASFLPLALSGLWGRLCPAYLAWRARPWKGSQLGVLVCGEISFQCLWLNLSQGAACALALYLLGSSIVNLCLLAIGQLFLVICLRVKANRHGGMSGDFMGTGIVCSQALFVVFSIP